MPVIRNRNKDSKRTRDVPDPAAYAKFREAMITREKQGPPFALKERPVGKDMKQLLVWVWDDKWNLQNGLQENNGFNDLGTRPLDERRVVPKMSILLSLPIHGITFAIDLGFDPDYRKHGVTLRQVMDAIHQKFHDMVSAEHHQKIFQAGLLAEVEANSEMRGELHSVGTGTGFVMRYRDIFGQHRPVYVAALERPFWGKSHDDAWNVILEYE